MTNDLRLKTKIIVTHLSPDVDALASVWLLHRYMPGFDTALVKLVQSGTTLDGQVVDSNDDIIHVDTGDGRFDHHSSSTRSSASALVFEYLSANGHIPSKREKSIALLVELVTQIDNFEDVDFPAPMSDFWCGFLTWVLDGHKKIYKDIEKIVAFSDQFFDGMQLSLQNKLNAVEDISVKGETFMSSFGRSIAMYTDSEMSIKLAQQTGYQLVVAISPRSANTRIKLHPQNKGDLSKLFELIKKTDKGGIWHYHQSGHMLINPYQASDNHPTHLTLVDFVNLIKKNSSSQNEI